MNEVFSFPTSFKVEYAKKNMDWGKDQGVSVSCRWKTLMMGIFYFQCEKEPKMFLL